MINREFIPEQKKIAWSENGENFENIGDEPEFTDLQQQRDSLQKEISGVGDIKYWREKKKWMNTLDEKDIEPHYRQMIDRIFTETDAFSEIEDTIGKQAILNSFKNTDYAVGADKVEFDKKAEFEKEGKENRLGDFNRNTKTIRISSKRPSSKAIWSNLAFGIINPRIEIVDHELVHFAQKTAADNLPFLPKITDKIHGYLNSVLQNAMWEVTNDSKKFMDKYKDNLKGSRPDN